MEELSEEVGVKESFTRTREEPAKVGWTYGKNGGEQLGKRADALRAEGRKTEIEFGGLWEKIFGGIGRGLRGVENEGRGVERGGGDSSEMGSVIGEVGNTN